MKSTILSFIFALGVLFLWLPLYLVKEGNRAVTYAPDASLRREIREETVNMSAEEILHYSVKKTAEKLTFTVSNNLPRGEANCVGYAQMCAGIANYAFQTHGVRGHARPVVGSVRCFGVNLCQVFRLCMPSRRWENFVRDHDFVEFRIDGKTVFADASFYDVLLTECLTEAE